jgi:hypothetical protein
MHGRSPIRLLTMIGMALAVAACSGTASSAAPGGPAAGASLGSSAAGGGSTDTSAPAGGTDQTSLVDAAAKVTDVCTLVATDVAAKVTPSAPPPQSQKFPPLQCTYFNGTVQLQVTLAWADTDVVPPPGTVPDPGLGAGAWSVHPGPDETYVTVLLSPDQGALYVDISDPSGNDRKDDAIAVAQAVLAKLH